MDQRLEVFVMVVDKKNFSRAAEELHMTQPAVSQYIRSLEESIGTRLLDRTNKFVRLNKAGDIVYHHAKEILGLYTTMQHLVDDLTNKARGPLSIGASYTFGEYVLPRIIAGMQKVYPDIEPSVTIGNTSQIASQVSAHQLDVGIVEGDFKEPHLTSGKVADDYMVVVAGADHPLVHNKNIKMEDLEEEKWICRETGSGTREAMEKMFSEYGISPKRQMMFSSTQPIKEAVEAGLGITLLSQWAIQKEVLHGELEILPIKDFPFVREFSSITASPFRTKALEVFLELLQSRLSTAIKPLSVNHKE